MSLHTFLKESFGDFLHLKKYSAAVVKMDCTAQKVQPCMHTIGICIYMRLIENTRRAYT